MPGSYHDDQGDQPLVVAWTHEGLALEDDTLHVVIFSNLQAQLSCTFSSFLCNSSLRRSLRSPHWRFRASSCAVKAVHFSPRSFACKPESCHHSLTSWLGQHVRQKRQDFTCIVGHLSLSHAAIDTSRTALAHLLVFHAQLVARCFLQCH